MEEKHCYWMAAFIDGEGSILFRDRGRISGRLNIVITLASNHRPLLEYAQQICGAGLIYQSKRAMQLQILRHDDVLRILKEIEPILILKRERAQRAISILEQQGKYRAEPVQ